MLRLNTEICASFIFLTAVGILVGCAAREIPPRYFVATSTIERKAEVPPEDDIQKVVSWAGHLLKSGKATVAFLPPSWCTAEQEAENQHAEMERKVCLALTAAMEKRAAENGYRVMDWRRLKRNPHAIAKQEQVDALFVIDDLSIHTVSMNRFDITNIAFAEQTSATERVPVDISNLRSVTGRCKGAEKVRQRRNLDQGAVMGASLSVKMVSAADGTATWFYRHSASIEDAAEKETVDYYYLSEGTKKTKGGKLAWGIIATSLGITAAVVGARLNESGTSLAQRNLGFGLAWASILPLTVGITLTTVGLVAQAKRPVYQEPDEVLCARPPFVDNPLASQPAPDTQSDSGTGSRPGPPDIAKTDAASSHSKLIDGIADHFLEAMRTLSLDRTGEPPLPSASKETIQSSTEEGPDHIVIIKRDEDKEDTGRYERGHHE